MSSSKDYKYEITKFLIKHRDKLIRVPLGLPLLIIILPIIYELMTFNFYFLREWIITNKYYTGYMFQMFVGPNQLDLWLHFAAIMLMVAIVFMFFKMTVFDRCFPMLVLKDGHSYKEESRIYWYTGNTWEQKWKKYAQRNGKDYEPEEYYITINKGWIINPINPRKSMIRIKIPTPDIILERETKELVVQDIGVIHRHSDGKWELTWDKNLMNPVDAKELILNVSKLLDDMSDETAKASKGDPSIRKKVMMDATFSQASSAAQKAKELINKFRKEAENEQ